LLQQLRQTRASGWSDNIGRQLLPLGAANNVRQLSLMKNVEIQSLTGFPVSEGGFAGNGLFDATTGRQWEIAHDVERCRNSENITLSDPGNMGDIPTLQ